MTLRPWRNWFERKVVPRLRQLQDTLNLLKARLRAAIADALGQTLGAGVRDAVLHVLDNCGRELLKYSPPCGPALNSWDDMQPHGGYRSGEHGFGDYYADDFDDRPTRFIDEQPKADLTSGQPLAVAASAALRAVSWIWPRRPSRYRLVTAVALMLLVGGAAYLAPQLTMLGLDLVGSTRSIDLLADGMRFFGLS
jgi:hypothetical protein